MTWLVLAAGKASRFGSDKLLAKMADGRAVLDATLDALLPAGDPVFVVTRPGHAGIADLLAERGVSYGVCDQADNGMGASLAWGVSCLQEHVRWTGIVLADMPLIATATYRQLRHGIADDRIIMPIPGVLVDADSGADTTGHPVLFGRCFFPELTRLSGDRGAKQVIATNADAVIKVSVDDPGIIRDIDTPDDLRKMTLA